MTSEQEAKRDLLKEYFASRPPEDIATLSKMSAAMARVGYPGRVGFSEAVEILYGKIENGETV